MTIELMWFVWGVVACLSAGAGVWIISLLAKTRRQHKQICGLMHDKGSLTMRISILEDSLKEKGKENDR